MQMAFVFDQTLCTNCNACVVACKDWHNVPAGPASWRRVRSMEKGQYPDVFLTFLSTACYHCAQPACIAVCSMGAITKRPEDGIVVVDKDACSGCGMCKEACPYDAPQFGMDDDGAMQKCNFCYDDRLAEGKPPICVASCPLRALDYGPLEEMREKYGNVREAEGFAYSAETEPSVVFCPKFSPIEDSEPRVSIAPYR